MTSVAGQLLRHPVQGRLCAPAAVVAAGAVAVLVVLTDLHRPAVLDAVPLAALVLALTTATASADPVGVLADATPTPGSRRLLLRAAPVLAVVATGWVLALAVVPADLRPPVAAGGAVLAAMCALVVAGGVVEARVRPRATEPLFAAAAVAMAWAAVWLLRPSWSPLTSRDTVVPAAVALVAAAVAVAVTRR